MYNNMYMYMCGRRVPVKTRRAGKWRLARPVMARRHRPPTVARAATPMSAAPARGADGRGRHQRGRRREAPLCSTGHACHSKRPCRGRADDVDAGAQSLRARDRQPRHGISKGARDSRRSREQRRAEGREHHGGSCAHMGAEHHVRVNGTRGVAGRASPPARPPPGAVTSSARAHRRDLKGTFIGRACRWGSATEIAPATESEVAPQKLSLVILLRWSRPTRRARKPEHFGAPSPDRRG